MKHGKEGLTMRQKELARIGARQMQGQGTKLDLGKAMDVDMMPLSGKELKCVEYLVAMESRVLEVGDAMRERRAPRMDVDALNACGLCLFSTSRLAFAPPEPLPHSASERQREHCRKAGRVKSEAKAAAVRKNIQKAIAARRTKS